MSLLLTFAELDNLNEATIVNENTDWLERETLIYNIKNSGKSYNFDKYSNAQLYRIWQRIQAKKVDHNKTSKQTTTSKKVYALCNTCGCTLTDGGYCPVCDDGDEAYLAEKELELFKENYDMNFQTILEELDRLYESENAPEEEVGEEAEEVEAEEMPEGHSILRCANCGALVIKKDTDVVMDEEAELANVEEECVFCGEAKGYDMIGVFSPNDKYEAIEEFLDEVNETEEADEEEIEIVDDEAEVEEAEEVEETEADDEEVVEESLEAPVVEETEEADVAEVADEDASKE